MIRKRASYQAFVNIEGCAVGLDIDDRGVDSTPAVLGRLLGASTVSAPLYPIFTNYQGNSYFDVAPYKKHEVHENWGNSEVVGRTDTFKLTRRKKEYRIP